MLKIIKMSVENPVLVNIMMGTIIIIGVFSFMGLPREIVSEVSFNWVFIITPYPGASSEEAEQLVTIPIEEEIQDIPDIDEVISQSTEGSSFIMVKFGTISDELFRVRMLDLKAEIDKIPYLPGNTRRDMIVKEFDTTEMVPVITLNISGPLSELDMRNLAVDVRRRVLRINGIAKGELAGTNDRQVWVELDPDLLETYGVSPDMASAALALANQNVPAGKVTAGRQEMLLRTVGRFKDADRIRKVIVRSMPGGDALSIGDIAKVTDGFEEHRTESHLNGQKSVSITVAKRSKASTIKIIDDIRALVDELEPTLPAGVEITLTGDTGVQIDEIMDVLRNNAGLGMILVVIFLYLAIGARNALFVAMGIPITFLATFIFMYYTGNSINGNSLFGLILVLGVVVDDAIIIVENCYRHFQMGKTIHDAAIDGAHEVAMPVIAATLTTVAAFLPLMLMPGIMGKFMRIIPIVVCLVLAASMVEAFVILPSHFAEWTNKRTKPTPTPPWLVRFQEWYGRVISSLIHRRGRVLAGLIALLVASGFVIPIVGVELHGEEEISIFQVLIEMPSGTSLDVTNEAIKEIEQACSRLPEKEILAVQGTSGLMRTESDWIFANNVGEVMLELVTKRQGRRSLDEIINELRGYISGIPGIEKISFLKPSGGPPTGKSIDIRILGREFDPLIEIKNEMEAHLAEIPGVVDVQNNWKSTKQELRIIVDEAAAAYYGLDLAKIASFIRTAFEGYVTTRYREGNDEVEVLVRYPAHYEKDMNTIERLKIPGLNAMGKIVWVPFNAVASLEITDSWPEIAHQDQDRYIAITADIEAEHKKDLVKINAGIQEHWDSFLSKRYPGYRIEMGGQFKEFEESFSSLKQLFLIGVFLIFVILGGQFKSFTQPFIILFTVPFAFIGSMIGLLIAGSPFSIVVMFGMVALAGVAVNDAIVMIDFVNRSRKNGEGKVESLINAGKLRLRPIFLTTVTTVGALLPTALGLGGRSETWSPLANVIVFGMLGAMFMTLFIIPCLFRILIDDIPGWMRRRFGREEKEVEGRLPVIDVANIADIETETGQ
jgi:multidrug efflux pump subunit AcrB